MKKSPDLTEKIVSYIPDHACIVDVGCGDGELLRSLMGKGYRLIGVDPTISEDGTPKIMIPAKVLSEEATSTDALLPEAMPTEVNQPSASRKDLLFLRGKAEALPLPEDFADIIVMQCVFSLCEPFTSLNELKRVLKPDGLLIITDLMSGTVSVDFSNRSSYQHVNIHVPDKENLGIGRILTREDMESLFIPDFSLVTFSDEKSALVQMLIEAIFNDDTLCISCSEREALKKLKAGYGFWVWKPNPA